MTNIKESPRWIGEVHQIARGDKVEGGAAGIANLQAKVLADRTQYLKNAVESVPDYREFTFYKTETDPDGTIAGLAATEEGQAFRVAQGVGSETSFLYYEKRNGVAVLQAALPGTEAINEVKRNFQILPDGTFAILGENGIVFAIDPTALSRMVSLTVQDLLSVGGASFQIFQNADGLYVFGDNGIPLALGPDSVLRLVAANISGVGFEADSMGVPLLFRGNNGIAWAIDNDSNFRSPGVITDKLIVGGKEITEGGSGGDSVLSPGDRYVNSDGDLVTLLPDTKKMSSWGSSSLVVSGGSANFAEMASELGIEDWNNQGQPGESSFQSAARFGGAPFTLNFPGNVIPASGAVNVTCTQLPSNFRNSYLKSFSGAAEGVMGTLSWSSTTLRFTRAAAGSEVSVAGGVDFIPTLPASYRDGVVILWMYKNDIKYDEVANPEVNEDVIFNNVVKTFKHLTALAKRCLVIGIFNDSSYSNPVWKTRLESLNNRMRGYFGDLYCDTQDYICSEQIWSDTGITPTASDLAMQAQGYKATSLSADAAHLNSVANNAVVQNVIKPKLVSLGWYK